MQVTGTISNVEGIFTITPVQPGSYYVDVQFISYDKVRISDIKLNMGNMKADLGTIKISPTAISLDNVVVEGERSPISYQIDKKVIDVDQQSTTISGNAAEVLENVPSVTVDIEGNVSLRGSSNFTVLVDGRPSILDPQDILQQIPASQIDNIEIITNPSAKYDPEGSAGIINIVMKKTKSAGIAGVANLNAGFKDKYGGDFLFEYKNPSFSTTFGIDYNNRFHPGTSSEEKTTSFNNVESFINTSGDSKRGRKMLGFRAGMEYYLTPDDVLSLRGRYGDRKMQRNSTLNYDEWNSIQTAHNFYMNKTHSERGGYYFAFDLNHQHKFDSNGHEILSELSYRRNNSDEFSSTELYNESILTSGRQSTENGPSTDLEARINYTLPFSQGSRFEAGYEGELDFSDENTGYYQYHDVLMDYVFFPEYSHSTKFDEREHALYSLYAGEIDKLGFQGGVRAEYTYRSITVDETNNFTIDTWDYFPTLHASYSFSPAQQIMASYTRRIDRPGGWALEPFETWSDANSVRRGNPALKPEYIDSYEAGFRTLIGPVSFSSELYYRVNHNRIENVRSAYAENVTLTTFENVGTDYSLGTELMLNFGIGKIWEANLMGNLYNYRIEGVLYNEEFSRESFNWDTRLNNNFKISPVTQLQLNARYISPSVSSQGRREGFFMTDVAVKQDFFNKALSVTLQIRDILGTGKYEFTSSGPDFYTHTHFTRESPMLMLNVRYNINNYKSEENRGRQEENGFEGEEEF
jgi:outer membrane receptor protein involved in Fe transport